MFQVVSITDLIALSLFVVLWCGYAFTLNIQGQTYNLVKVMHRYRLQWVKHMIKRGDRQLDMEVIMGMCRTSTIFAVLAALLIVGIIALF